MKKNYLKSYTLFSIFILAIIPLFSLFSEDCSSAINLQDKNISLKGGWLYQRGDNPDWRLSEFDDSAWTRKSVPDSGRDKTAKQGFGYFWYRCHIFFPEGGGDLPYSLAINIGSIRDADEAFFNGVKIGFTGSFPPGLHTDSEKVRIYSIPDNIVHKGKNVFAVKIYSSSTSFGLPGIPSLGREWKIHEESVRKEIIIIISGFVFILMGLFFGLGSLVKAPNNSNLFFSLFSVFLGFYTLFRTSYRYIMVEDFTKSFTTELLILYCLPILFINFFTEYLNIKRHKYLYVNEVLFGLLFLFTLFFARTTALWDLVIQINIVLLLLPAGYVIYLIKVNLKENWEKLRLFMWSIVFLFVCTVIDSITALDIYPLPHTLHIGFLFLLITISIRLSEEMVANYKNYISQESELMKMERVKTNFLFNVSDEFKSYLDRSQIIVRDLLVENNSEKEMLEKLSSLESLGGLMKSMVHDAVLLSQVENKKFDMYTERFTLKELVQEIISMLEMRHRSKRENLFLQIQGEDVELQQNKELIFLIFYHLLENIFLYTPESSPAYINIHSENKELFVEIKDEGGGIPQTEQADIFKKFVRGQNAIQQDIPGSGIGLTLVDSICQMLSGEIRMETNSGAGTKFFIKIPTYRY